MDAPEATQQTEEPATSTIQFDLSVLPPEDRFEFWHDYGSRVYRPVRFRGNTPDELEVKATLSHFGDVSLGFMSATHQSLERTARMIRKDQVDHFLLIAVEQGTVIARGPAGEVRAEAGDIALIDTGKECEITWTTHTQLFANLPRHTMRQPGTSWTPVQGAIKSSNVICEVARQHLKTLWNLQETETESIRNELGLGLSRHISHYFRKLDEPLTTQASPEVGPQLLYTIQDWIESNLHNPELNAEILAHTFHMSRSSIYELFTASRGVRNYITERRLQRAMDILGSTNRAAPARIQNVAIGLGFRSQAAFSRAFHQRWGQTPRDARRQRLERISKEAATAREANQPHQTDAEKEILKDKCTHYYAPILRNRTGNRPNQATPADSYR